MAFFEFLFSRPPLRFISPCSRGFTVVASRFFLWSTSYVFDLCVFVCRCPLAWWFIVYYLIFSALFQLALKRSLESQAGTSTRKRLQILIVVVQTIFVDARLCSIIIRLGVVSQSALFCKCTMNAVNSELDSLHNCLVALSKVKFSMCTLWQQLSNASWVRLN